MARSPLPANLPPRAAHQAQPCHFSRPNGGNACALARFMVQTAGKE